MSEALERLKKKVLGEIFTNNEVIDSKTYRTLSKEEKKTYEMYGNDYSRKVPISMPEDEQQQFINLKMLQLLYKIDKNIADIKYVVVFCFVLTIIGLL